MLSQDMVVRSSLPPLPAASSLGLFSFSSACVTVPEHRGLSSPPVPVELQKDSAESEKGPGHAQQELRQSIVSCRIGILKEAERCFQPHALLAEADGGLGERAVGGSFTKMTQMQVPTGGFSLLSRGQKKWGREKARQVNVLSLGRGAGPRILFPHPATLHPSSRLHYECWE